MHNNKNNKCTKLYFIHIYQSDSKSKIMLNAYLISYKVQIAYN